MDILTYIYVYIIPLIIWAFALCKDVIVVLIALFIFDKIKNRKNRK